MGTGGPKGTERPHATLGRGGPEVEMREAVFTPDFGGRTITRWVAPRPVKGGHVQGTKKSGRYGTRTGRLTTTTRGGYVYILVLFLGD